MKVFNNTVIRNCNSNVEYIDITSWVSWGDNDDVSLELLNMVLSVSLTVKIDATENSNYPPEGIYIVPQPLLANYFAHQFLAICFRDFEMIPTPYSEKITFLEYLKTNEKSLYDLFNSLPRLTEDEYYNLTLPTE